LAISETRTITIAEIAILRINWMDTIGSFLMGR
jgi:hypothetical protein